MIQILGRKDWKRFQRLQSHWIPHESQNSSGGKIFQEIHSQSLPWLRIPFPIPGCSKLIQPSLELKHLEFPSQILDFPPKLWNHLFPRFSSHGTNPKFWDHTTPANPQSVTPQDGNLSMRNFQSFYGAPWEDSHRDGNVFHSQGSSVSGCQPGVLPCSVLAPCRSGARNVRNNWVSSAQPLNISWIFLPDFSCAELPAPFYLEQRNVLGILPSAAPGSRIRAKNGSRLQGGRSQGFLGLISSLELQGGIWEGKFPKMRQRRKRKHGNVSDSLVLPPSEFLGCNSQFCLCDMKYSSPHRLSKGLAYPTFPRFLIYIARTLFTPQPQQKFLQKPQNSRRMEFLTAQIPIPPLLF